VELSSQAESRLDKRQLRKAEPTQNTECRRDVTLVPKDASAFARTTADKKEDGEGDGSRGVRGGRREEESDHGLPLAAPKSTSKRPY